MAGTVLVIDDNAAFRALARRLLTEIGLIVIGEAESVATGKAAAHDLKPEAILVDVMLPDGDGVALARELAESSWGPRVLVTSTYADAAVREEAGRSGAVGFVPKDELPTAPLGRLLRGG